MKNVDSLKFFYTKIFFEKLKTDADEWISNPLDPRDYAIAGGAIRDYLAGDDVKDIDVFCANKEAESKLIAHLETVAEKMNENDTLANFRWNNRWFQIIKGKYYDMETTALIDSFDFTICCAMLTSTKIEVAPSFYQDVLAKHLRINKITFPLSTLERMQKYIKKGYTACNGTLLSVAQSLADLDTSKPEENSLAFYADGTPRFLGID